MWDQKTFHLTQYRFLGVKLKRCAFSFNLFTLPFPMPLRHFIFFITREKGFRQSWNRCFSLKPCYVLKLVGWHLGPGVKRKQEWLSFVLFYFKFALNAKKVDDSHKHTVICLTRIESAAFIMCSSIFFSSVFINPCLKSVLYTRLLVCIRFVPILQAQRIAVYLLGQWYWTRLLSRNKMINKARSVYVCVAGLDMFICTLYSKARNVRTL